MSGEAPPALLVTPSWMLDTTTHPRTMGQGADMNFTNLIPRGGDPAAGSRRRDCAAGSEMPSAMSYRGLPVLPSVPVMLVA